MPILSIVESGRLYYRRLTLLLVYFLLIVQGQLYAQNTTLVYEPDYQIDAVGEIRFLEERVDGELIKRIEFSAPGVCTDYMQRRNADGSLRRLVWFYEGDPVSGNYTIEEMNSQPDGTWTASAFLEYTDGKLIRARFYSGVNLIEERKYEYDSAGVISEYTSKPSAQYTSLLNFRRPEPGTVEAFESQPGGGELLFARLRYDGDERLISDERFVKGKQDTRNVFAYDGNGKLVEYISYDSRDLPVRHTIYDYTKDGLPQSVVQLDVKGRVVFGVSYTREYDGENSKTIIKNSSGEVTGTIEYRREDGRDVSRTESFLLGDSELKIIYGDFDEMGNWLSKETATTNGNTLKNRTVSSRVITYF